MSAPVEAIRQIVEPAVKSAGLVLEDLDVRGSKNAIVRVIVDLPEDTTDNIGFDQVDAVTATISEALDENPRATAALEIGRASCRERVERRGEDSGRGRRHTRWPRDWSSDVCSSDLGEVGRFGSRRPRCARQ